MQNNLIYKSFKEATEHFTIAQVEALTITDIHTMVKDTVTCSGTFINNMKRLRLSELQDKKDEALLAEMESTLDTNIPNWRDKRQGKEIIAAYKREVE